MRGLLKANKNQKLNWVVPLELRDKMRLDQRAFCVDDIFAWCAKNQAQVASPSMLLAASQHLAYIVEESTFKGVAPEERIATVKKYKSGFTTPVIPSKRWIPQTGQEDCEKVLWLTLEGLYRNFYGTDTPLPAAMRQQLAPFMKLIAMQQTLPVGVAIDRNLAGQMHQKCVVKQQVKAINHQHRPQVIMGLGPEPLKDVMAVTAPNYPASLKQANSARYVFRIMELTDNLYIEPNQLRTALDKTRPLNEQYRKPIDFLLITHHLGKFYAEAHSNDVLTKIVDSLKTPTQAALQHQSFVIRKGGQVEQLGMGTLAPSAAILKQICESVWLQDVLADVAFLNGELSSHPRFVARQAKWPQFDQQHKAIRAAFPYKPVMQSNDMYEYMAATGRANHRLMVPFDLSPPLLPNDSKRFG
jgi:hypothetical protein